MSLERITQQMDFFCIICPEEYTDSLTHEDRGDLEVLQKLSFWAYLLDFYEVCIALEARILAKDPHAWLPFFDDMGNNRQLFEWMEEFCAVCVDKAAVQRVKENYFKEVLPLYWKA